MSYDQWRLRYKIIHALQVAGLTLVFLLSIALVVLGFLPIWVLWVTYFIPTIVAFCRRNSKLDDWLGTLAWNFFTGWTIVLWIFVLAYELQVEPKEED